MNGKAVLKIAISGSISTTCLGIGFILLTNSDESTTCLGIGFILLTNSDEIY